MSRSVLVALPVVVVLYGAALRLDALTQSYGVVSSPRWVAALQEAGLPGAALKPARFNWRRVEGRYISDPYTYIRYGREMRSFYAAHLREPLFPFATYLALRVLANQDVAVSFASAAFSVLAIVATFLLGRLAFSYVVGLLAAIAMAIEFDVITWGIGGWRDDAFSCGVVMSAYAMVRWHRQPTPGNASLLGVVIGLACLIRITAVSFLLPGLVMLANVGREPWRARLRGLAFAGLIGGLLVGPYLVNCWRVFGDPLYAINAHTAVYRAADGRSEAPGQSAAAYLAEKAAARPMTTLDTVALGLTRYPFTNKWRGFDPWAGWLGPALAWASCAGLLLFAGSTTGRLLLVLLVSSFLPYAATWRAIGDWRFTEHAYPFFLIAAGLALEGAVRFAGSLPALMRSRPRPTGRWLAKWTSILAVAGAGIWIVMRGLPPLVVRESLAAGEDVSIMSGDRDGAFYVAGWSSPVREGNVTSRAAAAPETVVRVPLPRAADYDVTLRLDPFPRPAAGVLWSPTTIEVRVNGRPAATLALQWNPDRVGSYEVTLARDAVHEGANELTLIGANYRVWYVRVRPRPPAG
jgi:4-amino-4-deoxy-L-arabinose transferase-like glycosyltransferase